MVHVKITSWLINKMLWFYLLMGWIVLLLCRTSVASAFPRVQTRQNWAKIPYNLFLLPSVIFASLTVPQKHWGKKANTDKPASHLGLWTEIQNMKSLWSSTKIKWRTSIRIQYQDIELYFSKVHVFLDQVMVSLKNTFRA